jgi:hypothetical protein
VGLPWGAHELSRGRREKHTGPKAVLLQKFKRRDLYPLLLSILFTLIFTLISYLFNAAVNIGLL